MWGKLKSPHNMTGWLCVNAEHTVEHSASNAEGGARGYW